MCDRTCFNKIFWAYIGLTILATIPIQVIGVEVMDNSVYLIFFGAASVGANLALVYGALSRTKNIGFSLFAALLTFIPIVNFWYLYALLTRASNDSRAIELDENHI